MTVTLKKLIFQAVVMLVISTELCRGSDQPKSYGPPQSNDNSYQNNYEAEFQRPLAVFTEKPVNVADFVLIPIVQVPSSDLRLIYRPQIDSVSKTEPLVMCKSLTKSFEATPAVQVPLQQPFYLYDEQTLIPFPKTVTILHGGYRMSIPVGVVVAPVPAVVFKAGPVFVTTLYAIPAGPLPSPTPVPVPVRLVPWSSSYTPYRTPYLAGPPSASPSPPSFQSSTPAPPPSPSPYAQSAAPSYPFPAPPPPPPQYSQPAPPAPAYYQHADYSEDADDLRHRDPPGKLYSQFAAAAPAFHNSKESPLLHQFREESEKNRNKYVPPSYSNQYQTIDA